MILNKIYEQFIKHTQLLDAIYKTVFIRVDDVISSLNKITFKRFIYNYGDSPIIIDYSNLENNIIRSYVVECMKNLFDKFFSFPKESELVLEVMYEDKLLKVIYANGKTIIPEELKFLEKFKVFPFFIIEDEERDFYDIFDYLFRFIFMKDSTKMLFGPLKDIFEHVTAIEEVDSGKVSSKSSASLSLMIEDLQSNKEEVLKQLEETKEKRDSLINMKNDLIQFAHFKDKYTSDYSTLQDEFDYLKNQKKDYMQKYQDILKLVKEIDGKLTDIAANDKTPESENELNYYLDKKKFLKEKGTILTNTIKEIGVLQDTTKSRLTELQAIFRKVENLSKQDLTEIAEEIAQIEKKQERLYVDLTDIESGLKHSKEQQVDTTIKVEKATYSDVLIQESMTQAIPDYLSKPDLPTSVLVVKNYLRQFFVYCCEKDHHSTTIAISQEDIAVNVLKEKFGYTPTILFSNVDIHGFDNVIKVEN